jgi:hypothetical protein
LSYQLPGVPTLPFGQPALFSSLAGSHSRSTAPELVRLMVNVSCVGDGFGGQFVAVLRDGADGQLGHRFLAERRLDADQFRAGHLFVFAVVVHGERLGSGCRGAHLRLRVDVDRLRLLAEQRRQGDRGEDPNDQDHDEQLDQREALLAVVALPTWGAQHLEHHRRL